MIPRELQEYKQWVCWVRPHGSTTKLPICPATGKPASCTDPASWESYRQARVAVGRFRLDGIGFVFTSADPYTGVDLDHCRTMRGEMEPRAADLVRRLHSYTEWSPSGEGLHILVKARLPAGHGRRSCGLELYGSARYFTITGDRLAGTPQTIEDRQAEILDLLEGLDRRSPMRSRIDRYSAPMEQSDEELIRRAQQAKNGVKFQKLWAGDVSEYGGDHSRADAALCSMLAYYTHGDQPRMDRLFRASGLYRPKWDRPTAGSTYGWLTMEAVLGKAAVGH